MTEGTKALNSAVSTLKKNPGRIGRLVKVAQFLIVPPKQYSKGKARELAEAAVAKLKAKRGLNGVGGEGAGSFSDKAMQKKAEDKKGAGYAAAGGAVGAGVGRAMAREYQKNTIIIRGSDRTIRQIQAGKPSSKIRAQTPVFNRRAAKTLKGAGRLGALAGAATGAVAGLGVRKVKNQMEKKAVDKKGAGYAATVGATGAAAGWAMGRDIQKHKNIMRSSGRNIVQMNKGVPLSKVYGRADTFDRRAARTVKGAGRRGALIGAVTGAVAGLGARKVEKAMEKKAVDKKTQDRALAASAVGSGAALGGVLTHDAKKSRVTSRMGTKGAYKHMGDPSVEGAEKRLANSAKTLRRMGKPLRRAGIKGAIVGGLAGAALGAAHLKKEAAAKPAVIPKQEFIGKGKIPAAKNVSPKTILKRKAGKVALGVAAGAALAGVAKKHLEKKAEEKSKKTSVAGLATLGAGVAGARRFVKDSNKFIKGTVQQAAHIERNGGKIGPMDVRAAMESGVRPILRRAGRATLKGAAVGALGAAALNKLRSKKDSK